MGSLVLALALWAAARFLLPTKVAVVLPKVGPAVQAVYATGTVEATVMMPVAARVMARLVKLEADEGQNVEAGQLLGSLEDEDLKNALRELQARARLAQSDLERNEQLIKRNAISQQAFDRSRSEAESARAAVASATAQLNYTKLYAPAAGVVIRRDGEVGQMIAANQAVFWLSTDAPLRISAEVDEEDISLVLEGQSVLIRADAFPGQVFRGSVKSITPKGDPVARSYRVRVALNEKTPLKIGMTAETNIIINQRDDALLVPSSAVIDRQVWHIVNGALVAHPVVIGAKSLQEIEIREGISKDDQIVLEAQKATALKGQVRGVLSKAP